MTIEEILNELDVMLDNSWNLPLSGGRCVIDADRVRDMIDDIRMSLPAELKSAQGIVQDHTQILEKAKKESENIIRKAEMRARSLLAQEEILKQAQQQAAEMQNVSQLQSREMRQAAYSFSDDSLRQTEEVMCSALNDLRATRKALRDSITQSNLAAAKQQRQPLPKKETNPDKKTNP